MNAQATNLVGTTRRVYAVSTLLWVVQQGGGFPRSGIRTRNLSMMIPKQVFAVCFVLPENVWRCGDS